VTPDACTWKLEPMPPVPPTPITSSKRRPAVRQLARIAVDRVHERAAQLSGELGADASPHAERRQSARTPRHAAPGRETRFIVSDSPTKGRGTSSVAAPEKTAIERAQLSTSGFGRPDGAHTHSVAHATPSQ
jgi:hypothetical protein